METNYHFLPQDERMVTMGKMGKKGKELIQEVAAAIILRGDRYLIAQRKTGHLAKRWEFPGGKVQGDESLASCFQRELREELGIEIEVGEHFLTINHDYGENGKIRLHAAFCDITGGVLTSRVHRKVVWARTSKLRQYKFAPADVRIVEALRERDKREQEVLRETLRRTR